MDNIGRKVLPHQPPLSIDSSQNCFFLTICALNRDSKPLMPIADRLLESARFYQTQGKWYSQIFLIMPDHVHGLLTFPKECSMSKPVRDWKRWTTRNLKVQWQDGFFDHRLRHDESASDKADYILQNPVRAGLVAKPEDWPFVYFAGEE